METNQIFSALVGIIATRKEIREKEENSKKKSAANHRVVRGEKVMVCSHRPFFHASKSIKLPAVSARDPVEPGCLLRSIL